MTHAEPGRLLGLHHVQLAMPPEEEQAAIDFYEGVLGLEQVPKPQEAGRPRRRLVPIGRPQRSISASRRASSPR